MDMPGMTLAGKNSGGLYNYMDTENQIASQSID